MAGPIAPVGLQPNAAVTDAARSERSGGSDGDLDFADTLAKSFTDAADSERAADETATRFAEGDPETGIHEAVIAAEKANVQVRYAVTLKNKLIDAYRQLMNTQV